MTALLPHLSARETATCAGPTAQEDRVAKVVGFSTPAEGKMI